MKTLEANLADLKAAITSLTAIILDPEDGDLGVRLSLARGYIESVHADLKQQSNRRLPHSSYLDCNHCGGRGSASCIHCGNPGDPADR